jgi:hypothetical protein
MGGGTQVSTSTTEPWAEQKGYLTGGFDQAKQIYDRGAPGYYPNETLAGFDPAQTAAQQATLGYAMGPRAASMQAGGEGALMRSLGGYTGFNPQQSSDLLAGNVRTGAGTPYNAMENALTQGVIGNLQQNILPGLRQQQVQYQPGGSSRAGLEQNKAVTNAVKSGLTKPLADMYSGAYQTAQGQRLPAANQIIGQQQYGQQMYPSIMSAPLNMYGAMGDVGAQRRAMTQSTIDSDMARYQYEATAPQQQLANYMKMVTGNYGGTTTQTTPGPSGLDQIGKIAGIASLFMGSDIRIKENIEPDGTWKGHNVYTYNFKGSNTRSRGVMAQEIEITRPDAVVEIEGIKHVNYGVL